MPARPSERDSEVSPLLARLTPGPVRSTTANALYPIDQSAAAFAMWRQYYSCGLSYLDLRLIFDLRAKFCFYVYSGKDGYGSMIQ
jgi:hypothetical protein